MADIDPETGARLDGGVVAVDAGPLLVSDAGTTPDTGRLPADAAVDAAVPPPPTVMLDLAGATPEGRPEPIEAGWRLDPGDRLHLAVPASHVAVSTGVALRTRVWRVEDGALSVDGNAGRLGGDGDPRWARLRARVADWTGPGYGAVEPPPLAIEPGDPLELRADGGTVEILGVALVHPAAPLPDEPEPADARAATTTLQVVPCALDGCDDGAALTAAVREAPQGTLRVDLAAGRYLLTTPVEIRRAGVELVGVGPDTRLVWSPGPDATGQRAAIHVVGGGPEGEAEALGAVAAGQRAFDEAAPLATDHALLEADDFGEVPVICENGRDVERFQRHTVHLARVLSSERGLRLDRGIQIDLPADASPRVRGASLLGGFVLRDVALEADCPEALDAGPARPPAACSNPEVVDDHGVRLQWTVGARVEDVVATGFGKFSVYVDRSLEARVARYAMHHPSAYGEGYGVHLIRSSRSIVRRADIFDARHAVVVDFGSSDSQVLDSDLGRTSLAVVDVHGEASRDTLIRGNRIRDGQIGVVVGGGGTTVHCNDGPRTHVEHNVVTNNSAAGVALMDATRTIFVDANEIAGSTVLVSAAFGAGDADVRRNDFGDARTAAILATGSDLGGGRGTGPVRVHDNLFRAHCSEDAAVRTALMPVEVEVGENRYCPSP